MALRYYANAPATALASSCTSGATSIQVDAVTGLPITYPFTLIIDRGEATEEAVSVTNASGTTLTVTRGYDSTTAFAHSVGAEVVHGITAADPREANLHVNSTDSVHGVTGDVVGTSDTQTLTGKTLDAGDNTINGITASRFLESDGTGRLEDAPTKAIPAGDVVGTSDTQTLTGKTVDLTDNTVTGTTAEFNTALSDGDFATQAGTETLTNKNLTSATNTFPAFGLREVLTYTANNSFTKATYSWLRAVRVRVVGAGGGGGGAPATGATTVSCGGGGGGGGYAEGFFLESELSASHTITIGVGGAAGGGAANGTAGTTSAFGALVQATGGAGGVSHGASAADVVATGAAGGIGSVGDLLVGGGGGGAALRFGTLGVAAGGLGGSSAFGGGGHEVTTGASGIDGRPFGGGGSGGSNGNSQAADAGGAGANGVVIVELYG